MSRNERLLQAVLRLIAVSEFFAILAVFMPVSWMARTHELIGLGPFPDAPLVPYLARHLSAFYAIHGGFVWVASCDVRRHAQVVRYIAWSGVAFAVFITVLDLHTGFPWYWWAAEGPGLGVLSVLMLGLQASLRGERPAGGSRD